MSSSSLIAACVSLLLIFLLSLLAYGLLRRYQTKNHSNNPDTPLHQLQLKQLKKNTQADFGVAYHELEFGKLLGKGSQGEVFRATWRGSHVAVKKIDTRKVPPEIIEEFCQEAEIMKRLRHPSLTLFMGVSLEHPHLCIVTEIVNRGSLFDIIHDETSSMTWKKCLSIAVDVAQGMTYLHGHSPPILHRDLKSLNILVDDNWRAKVADFGMTRFSEEGATMTQCGSPLWMAPEMIKNDPYDEKSDVYSFGICLWELYTRKIPYRELGLNPSHLVVKVVKEALRPSIPKQCPKPYVKLMEKCWHPLPERRPTFIQILRILESFTNDPAITGHKPMSTRNQNVVVRPSQVVDEEPQLNMAREFATVLNWRIPRADVEMDINPMDEPDINPAVAGTQAMARAISKTGDMNSTSNTSKSSEEKELPTPRYLSVESSTQKKNSDEKQASLTVTKPTHRHNKSMVSSILGMGSGAVQKAQLSQAQQNPDIHIAKYRGKTVAVKTCPLKQINTANLTGEQRVQADLEGHSSEEKVWDLMRLLGHVRHPNIVLFMGAYWENDHVGVVKEYMMRGTLEGIVKDTSLVLEWDTMLQLLIDAAQGMTYLHGMKPPIFHPDLSSSRLLVDKNWRVKIDDYGFVDLQARIDCTPLPPSTWSAPEILRDPSIITAASNVYSFGMIMYQLLVRKEPYEGETFGRKLATRIITEKYRPPFPPSISKAFAELISKCWHDDASQRPSFSDILATLQQLKSQGPPKVTLTIGVNAHRYRKAKTVFAYRSKDPITMMKDWGTNVGKAGCIIILSGEDDVYICDADVFESTYERCDGSEHEYRKTGTVIAACMRDAFAVKTNGGVEHGMAGDYLVQNESGDQWSIEAKTFQELYEIVR